MPIYHEDNHIRLHFGLGDVEVGGGILEGHPTTGSLVFCKGESDKGIGIKTDYEDWSIVPVDQSPVSMIFDKTESIDVIIRQLERAKALMIKNKIYLEGK